MFISNVGIVVFSLLQVAASTNKEVDAHIPNYPSLPPQLVCQLHNVTMHVSSVIWCIMVLWAVFFLPATLLKFYHLCHYSGRCWDRWSICTNDLATIESGSQLSLYLSCLSILQTFSWQISLYSKSRRMRIYLLNWVLPANSRQIISVKHWLQVILALMEDSQFPVEQLKKCFLHW